MRESTANANVYVDTTGLKDLARDLRRASPELSKGFRSKMKVAAEIVKTEAATRASFSRRIPSSLRVSVTGNGATVKVAAGGARAPDAAAIENRGKGFVRHPVFEVAVAKGGGGRTLVSHSKKHPELVSKAGQSRSGGVAPWTAKNSHPAYLSPALEAKEEEITTAIAAVVDETFGEIGFR